jgi:hypothetical protein
LKDFPLTTVRNPNSDSLSIHPHKSQLPSLSHTTLSSQPTLFLSTLMSLSSLITKPSMISAEETSISKDQHTQTWTDSLLKSSHHWLLPSDSTEPSMSTLLNSKPTWSHIQESTLCFLHMHQLSQLRKLTTNNSQLLKSPTQPSSQLLWWPNVTQDTVNIWLAALCTEEMSSQRMSTPL